MTRKETPRRLPWIRLPATFIYAGVDVERAGLFAGPRGRQIASRFTTIPTTGFAYATQTHREAWRSLVAGLEATLPLRRHTPGTLTGIDDYLHRRTAGLIGSLSHLVRGAAIDAILDGTERITRTHLDAIPLDHAAEAHSSTHAANASTSRPSAPAGVARQAVPVA